MHILSLPQQTIPIRTQSHFRFIHVTFNILITPFAVGTSVSLGNLVDDYTGICTGMRYYSFEIINDGYAHNVSFAFHPVVPSIYDTVYIRAGVPPDLSLPNGGGRSVATAKAQSSQGFAFGKFHWKIYNLLENLQPTGLYFVALSCANHGQGIPGYYLTISSKTHAFSN